MKKYKNKYRISSTRASFWDYRWVGAYFVTLNTKDRVRYFGEVQNGLMCLAPIGEIVEREWLKTPALRPDMNLQLGEYIIMPDHFHAIITIGENAYNEEDRHRILIPEKNRFGPQSKNLASIIRGFKIGVTKNARLINPDFAWQPRYHDIIIRDEQSYHNIEEYIKNNPRKWKG